MLKFICYLMLYLGLSRGAKALHFTLDKPTVFVYAPERKDDEKLSVCLWHLTYNLRTYFAYNLTVRNAREIVE